MTNPIWNQASWRQRNPVAKTTVHSKPINGRDYAKLIATPAMEAVACACGYHVGHSASCPTQQKAELTKAVNRLSGPPTPAARERHCMQCGMHPSVIGTDICIRCTQANFKSKLAEQALAQQQLEAEKLRAEHMRHLDEHNRMAREMLLNHATPYVTVTATQLRDLMGVKEAESRHRNSTDFAWNEQKQAFYPVMWGDNRVKHDTGR